MFNGFSADFKVFYRRAKRIAIAAAYSFYEDDCYTKASTLTFYTVQSIVPFLAFLLGVAKGFGFDGYLEHLISNTFVEQKEIAEYSISIANSMLQHIKEGVVIGVGVLFLIYAMVSLLSYIEIVLNKIWKIKEQRSLLRKVNDYVAIVIICPLILIVSSSFTLFLKTSLTHFHGNHFLEKISVYLLLAFNIVPWLLSWLLFFLLYFLLPNTKMRLWPTIIAAIIAGTCFQLWQFILINFQIQIFNYNVVYGTFAVIPLLLIWLQVSWVIALAGAELAANIDDIIYYDEEHGVGYIQSISRKQLGLMIVLQCLKTFYSGKKPLTDVLITRSLKIPLNITKQMLDVLVNGEVLAPIEMKDGSIGYHPYCDPEQLTINDVCNVIEKKNDFQLSIATTESLQNISSLLKKLDEAEKNSDGNLKLNELIKGPSQEGNKDKVTNF